MKYFVDRIVNGYAVCETEGLNIINIPLADLPEEVKEGSVLSFKDNKYALLAEEEEERKNRLLSLQDDIFG